MKHHDHPLTIVLDSCIELEGESIARRKIREALIDCNSFSI